MPKSRPSGWRVLFTALLPAFFSGDAFADGLPIAVAANFSGPMTEISSLFAAESGHRLLVSYGSTGKFYAQIRNGAPFAVFLAADVEHPARLLREKNAVPGTAFTYAVGKLAIWSRKHPPGHAWEEVLRKGEFRHLAIANPKLAPYGVAAKETLIKLGLWEALHRRIVTGESIAQAYQFVATRNADLGFVALSQLKENKISPQEAVWEIDQSYYNPLKQGAVMLKAGQKDARATAFLSFLKDPRVLAIIQRHGYELPGKQ